MMPLRHRTAFTLVELLVVTSIMAVFLGLVLSGAKPGTNGQIRQAAQSLVSVLTSAQSRALGNRAGSAVIFESGTAAGVRRVTVNSGTLTVGGGISSGTTFGLTKAGPGRLVLAGVNTYTGTTAVSNGVLSLNVTTGTLASASAIAMNGGTFEVDNAGATAPVPENLIVATVPVVMPVRLDVTRLWLVAPVVSEPEAITKPVSLPYTGARTNPPAVFMNA